MDTERDRPIHIPIDTWKDAKSSLERRIAESQNRTNKKKKARKPNGMLMLHFTYSLKDRAFIKYHVQQVSNLFFEYAVATNEDVSRDYLVIQMDDEDLDALERDQPNETRTFFSYDVDPFRELVLRNGITAGSHDEKEEMYNLIGCSNSQVQKHSYFFRRSRGLIENETRLLQLLPGLRELEREKGIPKRVKYAGLLFSGITSVRLPDNVHVKEIKSWKRHGYDFTDGPGLISKKLAHWVKEQLMIKGDCPSVFQIRYCGTIIRLNGQREGFVCKGVLVVDPRNEESYQIQVRESMLKISSSQISCDILQNTLGICDYSQPSPGRLGQQLICLLSGSVDKDDFLRIQREHLDCSRYRMEDPFAMAWLLALDRKQNSWSNFHKLLVGESEKRPSQGGQPEIPPLYKKCASDCERGDGKTSSRKVQLPIAASRNLFGAVFPELLDDILDEGECIVLLENGPLRPNGSHKEKGNTEDTSVIVTRSPSYYPGDVRVLRVVTLPDKHPILGLRNCILFSTKGNRPDPDKMGGGDLDGDKYLVIWHPVLLKYTTKLRGIPPTQYNNSPPQSRESPLSPQGDWIQYAALSDNSMLGEVEATFYKLAKQFGIDSPQIDMLNTLFSSLVDRIPTSLEAFEILKASVSGVAPKSGFVWEEMTTLQKAHFEDQESFDQLAPRRQLSSYWKFQEAAANALANTQNLKSRMVNDFGYHFLESLQYADISGTLNWLDARREVGHDEVLVEYKSKVENILWHYEVSMFDFLVEPVLLPRWSTAPC